jgi:anti-sigma factor (TIGR02949 family)
MNVQTPEHQDERERMIDCGTAVRMLWDYLDGHLGPQEVEQVRAHVTRCSHCFAHADFGQVVLDAVARLRKTPEPATVECVRARLLDRLRAEGYDGP